MATSFLTEKAPPEKRALYGALGVYPDKNSALAELIDNSGEYGNTTTVKIRTNKDSITISDDGAGLDAESIVNMFRIKRNEHAEGETGKFGYGFKSATSFLGSETQVVAKRGDTFVWGNAEPNDDWQYEIKVIPKGDPDYDHFLDLWKKHGARESASGTIVFIKKLKEELTDLDVAKLYDFVSVIYSINFKNKGISVLINDTIVKFRSLFGKKYLNDFDRKKVTFGDLQFELSLLRRVSDDNPHRLTIVRNNRVIVSGYSMGIPGITEPAMNSYQIILWCDDKLDDLLKMTPMKTINPNQTIDRGLRRALFYTSGLSDEITKIVKSSPEAKEVFVSLSQHTRILNALTPSTDKLPDRFISYISSREEELVDTSLAPATQEAPSELVVQVVSSPKIPTTAQPKVVTNSQAYTSGFFNIDLKPLGRHKFMWDIEERLVNNKLQIVVVFNYDIPFIRGIISGPRNEVAKDFINEALSQIVYSRVSVDKSIETQYKNTYRNISRMKNTIFGG